jgi:hypothetical protein
MRFAGELNSIFVSRAVRTAVVAHALMQIEKSTTATAAMRRSIVPPGNGTKPDKKDAMFWTQGQSFKICRKAR